MDLLDKILTDICQQKDIARHRIDDFYVCSPFTVARLDDGSIGSAGNYDVQNHTNRYSSSEIRDKYKKLIEGDPLLLRSLAGTTGYVDISLKVAIISALSQSLLRPEVISSAGLVCKDYTNPQPLLEELLKNGDEVTLIGYGGGLDVFCTSEKVKNLVVCDFMFERSKYKDIAWRRIKHLNGNLSRVHLVSDISKQNYFANSNVCYITASALCNGTMETLLDLAAQCREIIVQGPSCSLFPIEFFRRSVSLILTNKKRNKEFLLGKRSGDSIYDVVDSNKISIFKKKRL